MKQNVDFSIGAVLRAEGGYVNHPDDPGGPTNMGITLATARSYGVDIDGDGDTDVYDVKALPESVAMSIYKQGYWDTVRGDELPSGVDHAMFDFSINSGPVRAIIYLQNILEVAPDGKIGPITMAAIKSSTPRYLINRLCDKRLAFLQSLSTWNKFGRGWSNRIVKVRSDSLDLAENIPPLPADKPEENLLLRILRLIIKALS